MDRPLRRYSETEILKLISSVPRGLPSSLAGMDMEDLAQLVATAEPKETVEGEIIIKLGKRWYYGDPKDAGTFLQHYRGRPPDR